MITPSGASPSDVLFAENQGPLLRVTAAIAEAVTDEEVFEALVDHVGAVLGASSTGLWLLNDSARSARLARSIGYHAAARAAFETLDLASAPPSPIADALRNAQPVWLASQDELVTRYPKVASEVSPDRNYRVVCLPVSTQGRVLGALALTIEEARPWREDEREFLMLVGRYTAQALARLELLEAERAARAKADATAARACMLSAASRAFTETDLDMGARLTGIVTELGRQMTGCVGIALLDADGLLRTVAAYHPVPEATQLLLDLAQRPLRLGEGIAGGVAQTGQSVLIPKLSPAEISRRASPGYRAFLERYPAYAMMCSPLRTRGRVIGVVSALRTRADEIYTQDDQGLLDELAEVAAAAIENGRLHQENADGRARAEQLYRFANAVVGADKQEQLFDAAMDAIEKVLRTDRAAVLLFDRDGVMRFRSSRGLSEEYRRAVEGHSPWSQGDSHRAQPVLVSDVHTDPSVAAFRELFEREAIGALAFFPIQSGSKLLGKLMVYHRAAHHYDQHEVDMITAIGAHLGSIVSRFVAIDRLQEIVHYNDLFAGILAHDLRNPLAAIVMAAQVMHTQLAEADQRFAKPLSKILTSGERMSRMIGQLLDVTRFRAGGDIKLQWQSVDLRAVCAGVIGELELAHPSWKICCASSGNTIGRWDRDRLAQVFSNLLSNAGQHGSGGGVISVVIDGWRSDAVSLKVHNLGSIPTDLLPTLFDPFRGTSASRGEGRGLGLGLYIVNEIVRAHGGTIQVDSDNARGTMFTLSLPR